MSFITWILSGLVSGLLIGRFVDRRGQQPLRDMALGVLGAFAGGLLFHLVGQTGVLRIDVWSVSVSALGAATVLLGYHAIVLRSSRA
jgi:uncharacterized membrane protein YeaQ/YmgE (transglycosylase-associated protein family)